MAIVTGPFRIPIYVCWGVLAAVWIVGALYNRRRAPKIVQKEEGFHLGGWTNWIAALVLFWGAERFLPQSIWAQLSYSNPALTIAGLALLLVSTAFTIWARWVLGAMWTGTPTIKANHELQTHGPYGITRHPIYTGLIAMFLGTILSSGLGITVIVFVLFIGYFALKVRAEERLLLQTFGQRYRAYQRRVPGLLPFPRLG